MANEDVRLEAIESQLAFQEDALLRLNEALVAQQARIDRLEATIDRMAEQISAEQQNVADNTEPPPPHY